MGDPYHNAYAPAPTASEWQGISAAMPQGVGADGGGGISATLPAAAPSAAAPGPMPPSRVPAEAVVPRTVPAAPAAAPGVSQEVTDWAWQAFPASELRARSQWMPGAGIIGSMLGYVPATSLGNGGGDAAASAMAQTYKEVHNRGRKAGAPADMADAGAALSAMIAGGLVPPQTEVMLDELPAPAQYRAIAAMAAVGARGVFFGGTKEAQRFAASVVARPTFDPHRSLTEAMGEGAPPPPEAVAVPEPMPSAEDVPSTEPPALDAVARGATESVLMAKAAGAVAAGA